jgi:superfamily II DNA or RNA helicase
MTTVSYAEFLERKQRRAPTVGPQVTAADVNPALYEWQREGVAWAVRTGRSALLWDCGLGKTFAQLEWARLSGLRALILAPLSVARQTVREAEKIDEDVPYVRSQSEVKTVGTFITNYEMAERFDPDEFDALVLDESSVLKNVDGKTRRRLTERFARIPLRLCATATPAPNDASELCNHAEFLGVMSRQEMLSAFFINDGKDWRLKGHAAGPMFQWMASWAMALRRPSDIGYPDGGFVLPPLEIVPEVVGVELESEGQLFPTTLGGVGGRARVRRETLAGSRASVRCELGERPGQWIVWCGLNDEADAVASRARRPGVNVEGKWKPDAKAEALEAFQDGEVRVLVTKPAIAGFGMNFQNCHQQAFCGIGDSYEAYYQCIRRSWRFGQQMPVRVHVIVSELEQQIVANVRRKETENQTMTARLVEHMSHARMEVAA